MSTKTESQQTINGADVAKNADRLYVAEANPPGMPGSISYVEHPQALYRFRRDHAGGHTALRGNSRERGILAMLAGWLDYADEYRDTNGDSVADDGYLGSEWIDIGKAIRSLLNGDTGHLDCGSLDSVICDTFEAEGINPDTYEAIS
jgi:hypothetical protein